MTSNLYTEELPVLMQLHLWEDTSSEKYLPTWNFMILLLYNRYIFSTKGNLFQDTIIGSVLSSICSINQIYYKLQRKNE